ncbi:MAG: hypothetical protein PHN69_00610 [Candidatus Pacebacteria bacterium]|nr:hypothetical protein [Candidatus Paceibacterota bacterium]
MTPYNESKTKEPRIDSVKLLKIKINIINNKKEKYEGNKKIINNKDISIIILNNFM